MSVEFSNAYQEILFENLMAVIKQNFVFQTQMKLNEGLEKQKTDLMIELENLKTEFESVKNQASQMDIYRSKAEQNNSAHEEKSRIQSALNDELKKTSVLQQDVEQKKSRISQLEDEKKILEQVRQKEISELKDTISKLEELVPPTKLKKLGKTEQVKEDTKIVIESLEEALDPQPIVPKQSSKAVIDRFIPVSVQGGGGTF
jgi:chromosome segregation ATPase